MSYAEMQTYRAYTEKNGPLSVLRMYDRPAAVIAYMLARVNGNDVKFSDYMPFGKTTTTEATG